MMWISTKKLKRVTDIYYDKGIAKGYELGSRIVGNKAFAIGRDNLELSEVLKEVDYILRENRN